MAKDRQPKRYVIQDDMAFNEYSSAIKYNEGDILQFWHKGHSWPAKIISVKKVDGLYHYELG